MNFTTGATKKFPIGAPDATSNPYSVKRLAAARHARKRLPTVIGILIKLDQSLVQQRTSRWHDRYLADNLWCQCSEWEWVMSDGGCFDALEVTSEQTLPETVQGPREYVYAASRRHEFGTWSNGNNAPLKWLTYVSNAVNMVDEIKHFEAGHVALAQNDGFR